VDVTTQETTLTLLEQLQAQEVMVMVSTHDLTLAMARFDQVLLLNRHLIAYGPAAQVFTAQTIAEAFGGQALFIDGAVVVDQCCPPGHVILGVRR
jgi:ABC-type Mn2+/Zn2+ transport system ATPase subunit